MAAAAMAVDRWQIDVWSDDIQETGGQVVEIECMQYICVFVFSEVVGRREEEEDDEMIR